MTIEKVFTIQEIMEILRVSMATVTTELTSGRLKSFRIGRQYRITESNLQAYMRGEFEPCDFSKEDVKEMQPVIAEVVQEIVEPVAIMPVAEPITPVLIIDTKFVAKCPKDNNDIVVGTGESERDREPSQSTTDNNNAMPIDTLGKMLEQNEVEGVPAAHNNNVDVLRLMKQLRADGMKNNAIAKHLNSVGLKTARGCAWTDDTVFNALKKNKK